MTLYDSFLCFLKWFMVSNLSRVELVGMCLAKIFCVLLQC